MPGPLALAARRPLAALTLAAAAACGGGAPGTDSAVADTASPPGMSAAPTPVTPAAPDSAATAMGRAAPKDSNQAFLRMMSDHHEGLVAMSDSAQARLQGATAVQDADRLGRKQKAEQKEMLGMLARQYGDSVRPMILPSNRTMIDSVTAARGPAADTVYYRQVVAHHREGVGMAEAMLPHLTGETRRMAEKAVAEQRREIREFARKAGGAAGESPGGA
jgi:uncharacterized protein (DUF305 family)